MHFGIYTFFPGLPWLRQPHLQNLGKETGFLRLRNCTGKELKTVDSFSAMITSLAISRVAFQHHLNKKRENRHREWGLLSKRSPFARPNDQLACDTVAKRRHQIPIRRGAEVFFSRPQWASQNRKWVLWNAVDPFPHKFANHQLVNTDIQLGLFTRRGMASPETW